MSSKTQNPYASFVFVHSLLNTQLLFLSHLSSPSSYFTPFLIQPSLFTHPPNLKFNNLAQTSPKIWSLTSTMTKAAIRTNRI
ncbi:hypothetical protein HanRHA438_Chr02g0064461 [Helianthus annuus]|uniref:Uncharacterized protein n=1 Tax=Helianthus annuus TaxID=4232 RepID=A0A251VGU1_HELAN|nr:hypothetical protein HanXRQr2_Chr02g0063131 [Helianthus annuus]KAJ0939725.1 hypothetical protein HanRHA438_Chr02g0064461 [Helianthus annuus]KAJ0951598.1 hypothetical protein HanPSC8_Chr02g0062001 [Helianthus annuus]